MPGWRRTAPSAATSRPRARHGRPGRRCRARSTPTTTDSCARRTASKRQARWPFGSSGPPPSIITRTSAPNPSPPGEEVKERHEERATNDRPDDGKRIAAHAEDEGFGEGELARDPSCQPRTDEPDSGGDNEPAAGSAGQSSADGATDRGDDDQHDESWQCERHFDLLESNSIGSGDFDHADRRLD